MEKSSRAQPTPLAKSPTGIAGLDHLTASGLPRNRITLVWGELETGKTVLALQSLIHGATVQGEAAIFVAFEENSRRLSASTRSETELRKLRQTDAPGAKGRPTRRHQTAAP